jgi:hypothetical protein
MLAWVAHQILFEQEYNFWLNSRHLHFQNTTLFRMLARARERRC